MNVERLAWNKHVKIKKKKLTKIPEESKLYIRSRDRMVTP